MEFDHWWELNKQYCEGQSARYIALRAWGAVKAFHRIPEVDKDRPICYNSSTESNPSDSGQRNG